MGKQAAAPSARWTLRACSVSVKRGACTLRSAGTVGSSERAERVGREERVERGSWDSSASRTLRLVNVVVEEAETM